MCHYSVQDLEEILISVLDKLNNDHRLAVERKNRIMGTIVDFFDKKIKLSIYSIYKKQRRLISLMP